MQSQDLERGEAGPLGRTGWARTVGFLECESRGLDCGEEAEDRAK